MSRATELADRIELSLTSGLADYYSAGRANIPLVDEMADEATLALALGEMRRRRSLLGDAYPFVLESSGARSLDTANEYPYAALLMLSEEQAPFRRQKDWTNGSVVFEELAVAALSAMMGERTRSLRFGTPHVTGRPPGFADAMRWLADEIGLPMGVAKRPSRRNDGGVDVVVWRPWSDGQPGFPIFLVQCTLERDPRRKAEDVNLRLWSDWISFGADPSAALAVPAVLDAGVIEDLRYGARIILDRLRLAELLASTSTTPSLVTWLRDQNRQLVDEHG